MRCLLRDAIGHYGLSLIATDTRTACKDELFVIHPLVQAPVQVRFDLFSPGKAKDFLLRLPLGLPADPIPEFFDFPIGQIE